MRHHSPRFGLFRRWLATTTALAGVLPVLALTAPAARANPEGGSVVQGAATITQTNPKTVTVNQTTDKAVINWRSFSIGADETTRFNQPSSSSTTLNRVNGDQVSQILGNLSANGKVFLVNPNGIVFGTGSKIDVAALVASTADIKNENFMAGNLRFDIPGKVGAEIINQGTITAADGGLVALVSPVLRNSGIIQARLGKVALASANGVTLDLYGDNLILFQAADKITQQMVDTDGKPVTTAIDNSGRIYADGGSVLMTANTAKGVVDNAINTTGLVSARAVEQQGGEIVLKGEDGGIVQIAGSLDASGTETGQTGGRVQVTGEKIGLFNGTRITASGDAGGGTVAVGGDYLGGTASDETLAQLGIRREDRAIATAAYTNMAAEAQITADAVSSGNGGKVVLWSDNRTIAYGTITAKGGAQGGTGGFIEVSGKKQLEIASLTADASAAAGKAGTVLYDPGNVYITSDAEAVASYDVTNFTSTTPWNGRTNIAASNIEAVLNNGTNVVIRATPEGPDVDSSGDVYVQHSINKTRGGEAMLSLFSADEIHVESGVSITSTSGKLNLYFDADYDRHSYGAIFLDAGSVIKTNGGFVDLNGSDFYRNGVINTSQISSGASGDSQSGAIKKSHDYFTHIYFNFSNGAGISLPSTPYGIEMGSQAPQTGAGSTVGGGSDDGNLGTISSPPRPSEQPIDHVSSVVSVVASEACADCTVGDRTPSGAYYIRQNDGTPVPADTAIDNVTFNFAGTNINLMAYSNGGKSGPSEPHQCVDLVKDYIAALGINYTGSIGNGQDVAGNIAGYSGAVGPVSITISSLNSISGGDTPSVGAVMSFDESASNQYGHVAIVKGVSPSADGKTFTITLMEQNMAYSGGEVVNREIVMTRGDDGQWTSATPGGANLSNPVSGWVNISGGVS